MNEEDILIGTVLDEVSLTLEELAPLAGVSTGWVVQRIEEGFLSAAAGSCAADWRFGALALQRVRRLHALERDFEASPELAALVADLLEELDRLRARRA